MAGLKDQSLPLVSSKDNDPLGELAPLHTSGKYMIDSIKYPDNVGSSAVPHYIVFNIYVPDNDTYAITTYGTTSANSRSQNNMDYLKNLKLQNGQFNQTGIGAASVITGVKSAIEDRSITSGLGAFAGSEVAGQGVNQISKQISFRPKIKQIAKSIAIYMPDTIMNTMKHDYNAISATEALGNLGLASAIGGSISASIQKSWEQFKSNGNSEGLFKQVQNALAAGASSSGGTELLGSIAQGSGLVGPGFTDLALKSSGISVNPQVELLYRGTANRTFVFEFRFQPRSSQESQVINDIIQTFKIFSSPSIQPSSRGRYFIVPGQFDITFKFGNETNQFISKISTCVLNDIDINYAGAGQWASFDDGAPVEILLQLRFTEGEIITRELLTAKDGF